MTITRIFRVQVHANLLPEFEEKFADISVNVVKNAVGSLSVTIARPTKWRPNEYAMISEWKDIESLSAFAGGEWNRPVIPTDMEKFVEKCWVHHYESWD